MKRVLGNWLDRQGDRLFILPSVLMILAFSIFPLLLSAYLALSRFQLGIGGYQLHFVGFANFAKLLFGSEQYHFLGVFAPIPWLGWLLLALLAAAALLGHPAISARRPGPHFGSCRARDPDRPDPGSGLLARAHAGPGRAARLA